MTGPGRRDDRAVSVTVSYALNLALATMLITSLLLVTGDVVRSQQESAIRSELSVVGQQLAANIMGADRMVEAGGTTVVVRSDHPTTVAGARYSISIEASSSESTVTLESNKPDVTVDVPFANATHVENSTIAGGDAEIVYDDDEETLEVTSG